MTVHRRTLLASGFGMLGASISRSAWPAAGTDAVDSGGLQTLHVFHSWQDDPHNPREPTGPLYIADDGACYGTTHFGGPADAGTIFRMSVDGSDFVFLHEFEGPFGGGPATGLIQARDGQLYGTTPGGGQYSVGTLYSLTLGGRFATLYSFGLGGQVPASGLYEATDGQLYGTTRYHPHGAGCLYRFDPRADGNEPEVLHVFAGGVAGVEPDGGVVEGPDGRLYGGTLKGGRGQRGTLWRWSPAGFEPLHDFSGQDGGEPIGSMTLTRDGELFGVTSGGGTHGNGTVYHLARDGQATTLASLNSDTEGVSPSHGLLEASDGHLYLTTSYDYKRRAGALVRVTRDGHVHVPYRFRRTGPQQCQAPLIEEPKGTLLGVASAMAGEGGAVFSLRRQGR
ncbi:choice-of-anchor tandem repeat GloVer-containing protein [Ideonella sp. YS5]|uniref:choice-of-anchor tandem repeat GloVer-containing protein n=1 Tax=Ideonella sp. YS5 TaxID=3453714 RepID=UPI003EEAB511